MHNIRKRAPHAVDLGDVLVLAVLTLITVIDAEAQEDALVVMAQASSMEIC
jgi:hypothetical protein